MSFKMSRIITLCGSTRFKEEFELMAMSLIDKGWFVRSVEVYDEHRILNISKEYETYLEEVHLHKIDICRAIFVIDKNGYIGESTRAEIQYAYSLDKDIWYMSNNDMPDLLSVQT